MRPAAVLGEARRNLLSGTTRAAVLVAVAATLLGVLAVADVRAVVGVVQSAAEYRAAAGSVQVLDAPGQVDGARCEALARVDGVVAAGAVRAGGEVRSLNLPSTPLTSLEVTPGLGGVLGAQAASAGIWLPHELAVALGASAGDVLATDRGAAVVGAVFAYPADGRDPAPSYAVLEPVPAGAGAFDACWAEVWPADERTTNLLWTVVDADPDAEQPPTLGPLNTTLGRDFDPAALLQERVTRFAPWAALVVGLALGLVAVRLRRLELAATLHAGVGRSALAWQVLVETLCWVLAAAVVAGAVVAGAAAWHHPAPDVAVWWTGMRTVAVGLVAVLGGAVGTALATRESHLFRWFKER
ncbi:hypothetical protein ATJ88_0424 [Isoptericola jiangsuensis]|uniref:FtsX-like permease family protein n=2 Tax=Isoptericola jiangsuensis TaxID=548579 RepID=A0A2A9ETB8_9MICO|nr:hypothetical protein ATJ88_0424 [Isoptericola jiangsuensis]